MPDRRWLRIIPVAFIMYTIAFVDRTNISLAIPSMSRDLHMDPAQAGDAAGVFFWGYLLLQIPGGYLAHRWSAKKFVSILLVLWGLAAVGCGMVTTWREFWAMRFLLGVAEGGVWPAVLVMLSHWFPRTERARANAYWMLCLPVAVVVSSPLSGWILGRWDWRVLLISEGALPFVWLLIWRWFITDHPHQAGWISAEELEYLETTLRSEAAELEPVKPEPYLRTLLHPQVVLMVSIYFLLNAGAYGYLFWLPSALAKAKSLSSLAVGILFAIPYLITGVAMVLNSQHSDKTRERRRHVALGLAWGGICLSVGAASGHLPFALAFFFIFLANAGVWSTLGPFWAIPTETLPRHVAATAMGVVNAIGNLGGYFGPLAVGTLNKHTGNFHYAFALLSVSLLAAAGLALLLAPTSGLPLGLHRRERSAGSDNHWLLRPVSTVTHRQMEAPALKVMAASGRGWLMAKRIYQIISWGLLALTFVSILLVLRKPSFPTADTSPEAARSFDQKISRLGAPSTGGVPSEIRLTEAELNSGLQENLSPPATGGVATLKSTAVHLDGEKLFGLFTVEVSGMQVYLMVGGRLGVNNRAVEFTPTDIKLGSLPVPVSMVGSTLRDKLSAMREQMKLPDSVQDIRIENGEVVLLLR